MINNLTLLTYTHSNCVNLHEAYFGRIKKYFPSLQYNIVTCNTPVPYSQCIEYNDNDSYSVQMINALELIQTDYLIYSQEDYILFDYVNDFKIVEYTDLLAGDPDIHFIRLIKSGVGNLTKSYNNELSYIDPSGDYYFSTQITIWKKETLLEMFKRSQVRSVFDEPQNSFYLRSLKAIGLYTTQVGSRVGGHYNSAIYPYIATARVKGAWNLAEYPEELQALALEYNLEIS